MNRFLMSNLTWKEYQEKIKMGILIIPIGSIEQHGPHLPLGVDSEIAENFALIIAEKVGGVVAPTLTYGYKSQPNSGGGPIFPGTIDLNGSTLIDLCKDILTEFLADGWQRILIMNAHYENEAFLAEAVDLLLRNQTTPFPKVVLANWWDNISASTMTKLYDEVEFRSWALEHAALAETSLMMYFCPELVGSEPIDEDFIPPTYQTFPVPKTAVPASGCLYTAKSSSAEKGRLIVEDVVRNFEVILGKEFA